MTAETIILAILSVFLGAFLLVAIVAVVYLIKILRSLKRISDQAEDVSGNLASFTRSLRKNITPVALAAAVVQALKKLKVSMNKKESNDG